MKHQTKNKTDGRRSIIVTALASLFFLAVTVLPAGAHTEGEIQGHDDGCGFYLGLTFAGSSLHADNQANQIFFIKDDGGGIQLKTGYHFTPTFALELSLGVAQHETSIPTIDAGIAAVQIFALYRFSPNRPFRPYIKGGFGGYALILTEGSVEARIEGGGVTFGGGFDYFFSSHFSLGLDFTHNVIQYDKLTVTAGALSANWDIDEDGTMSSLGLALTYHF